MRPLRLTRGERLRIERLRKGQDQHAAAASYGVSRDVYQDWERATDGRAVMRLHPHEWCRILRLRAKKVQREVAADLNVTRGWVNRMEVGLENCDALIRYWENQQ